MARRYTHLQAEERLTLSALHQQGHSRRAIARHLGRSPSTVCRELLRNNSAAGYASRIAQARSRRRRKAAQRSKLCHDSPLWTMVCSLLHQCWSPRQIVHALKCQCPDQPKLYACPETIYRAIYAYLRGNSSASLSRCCARAEAAANPAQEARIEGAGLPTCLACVYAPARGW